MSNYGMYGIPIPADRFSPEVFADEEDGHAQEDAQEDGQEDA